MGEVPFEKALTVLNLEMKKISLKVKLRGPFMRKKNILKGSRTSYLRPSRE
jgi:hypothetical protein